MTVKYLDIIKQELKPYKYLFKFISYIYIYLYLYTYLTNQSSQSNTSPKHLPSKHLLVLKTSWRRFQDMSWRHLQHVFSVTILRLPRRLEDVKLLHWRRLEDMPWRCLEDMSWRRLEDILKTCFEDVLKTCP